jgi:hypothetical protein
VSDIGKIYLRKATLQHFVVMSRGACSIRTRNARIGLDSAAQFQGVGHVRVHRRRRRHFDLVKNRLLSVYRRTY